MHQALIEITSEQLKDKYGFPVKLQLFVVDNSVMVLGTSEMKDDNKLNTMIDPDEIPDQFKRMIKNMDFDKVKYSKRSDWTLMA